MAVIHRTTLTPTKLELLTAWLPSRPWYRGGAVPEPAKAGGFRLDDPQGEVGIEFMVVTDASGGDPAAYLVPLTYRGAPLPGAEHALVGTTEHGVLGHRWVYDGCQDPVLVDQLLALMAGLAPAQDQSASDTPDREVTRSAREDGRVPAGFTGTAADGPEGTDLPGPDGAVLRVRRVLRPGEAAGPLPAGVAGRVGGAWQQPDGTRVQGLFAELRTG
ncbi:1,4-alpha-glucan branching protein [Kitasatospora sp. NPDC094015]|uniref:maltokinase N-terminal cap-like domain-containing protein n=1 Tax=Kitasatospora sp. NPDC094015 TaxID=3155205 RepID=UPI00332CA074